MVKKVFIFFIIVLISSISLFGYEYLVEPCEIGGAISWSSFGSASVTNYSSQGSNGLKCFFNNDGSWSGQAYTMYEIARFVHIDKSISDIKSIKMDIYNPHRTNISFRIWIATKWDTSKWQFSSVEEALTNQWTTLEFDLTQDSWNPISSWNWPDTGSWDKPLHGKENVDFLYLEIFKNDGDNINFTNTWFILDNIRFEVDDKEVLDFEGYEDKTMTNGSKREIPGGSTITNYIVNNAYQGTQAMKIEYNIASNTNGVVWLPQVCRNFTNIKWLSFVAKGTAVMRIMLSESYSPPTGINSDGDVWASTIINVSNSDWDTFYVSMNSFSKYSGSGATKDMSYITNIGFKIYSGSGSVIIDKIENQTEDYFANKIVGIFPSPGSIFTNSYNKCKIFLETGFDYDNFKININGEEYTKNSSNIEIDTNAQFIQINNLDVFNNYEILKFNITDTAGLNYSWMYYKKKADIYEYSIIDNFENNSVNSVWSTGNSDGSSITLFDSSSSYEGNSCVQINYSIISNGWVNFGRDVPMINISQYQYIEFFAKGYGNLLFGVQEDLSGSVNLDGEVWASATYPLSSSWQKFVIPIDSLTVTGSSAKGGIFDKSKIRWIEFDFNQVTDGTNKTAYVDYIKLVKAEKEFKLLSYLIPTTNEIFLLFNGKLNETSDTLTRKIYELNNLLNIKSMTIEANTGNNTGGIRIKLNSALENNKIYTLYISDIEDISGRKFSDKIYILNLNATYKSGNEIPVTGGTLKYGDVYVVVNENSFNTAESIVVSKVSENLNKNYTPIGDMYKIKFNNTPNKKLQLILPYFKIDDTEYKERNFKVAYFDGVNWIPVNSEVNEYGKYIISDIDKSGIYGIVEYTQTDKGGTILSYNDVKVYPDIFSPNGDGINDKIIFSYYLNKPSYVTIKVLTLNGKLVKEIVSNVYQAAGFHSDIKWDGSSDNVKLKRGIYLYKIETVSSDNSNIQDSIVKTITIFR